MSRLNGKLPQIGIRPAIDGRREGIRESLEERTMGMALSLKSFLASRLRHPSGEPVECIVSNSCIGGVAESVRCEQQFREQNIGLSITVTPCWCYGTETIDMTEGIPKAIWGFNGSARPGAVYLAAALAAHDQLGIPAFGIYGSEVQEPNDTSIPEDVQNKLLCFAQAGLAAAHMKGKSYLSLGSVSMGIAGSVVQQEFLADYLNMRTEFVDMSEVQRRLTLGIYDPAEYKKALSWTKANCPEGKDFNKKAHSPEQKNIEWQTVVKMTLIMRDLMIGNPKLAELGYVEEAEGHNAIAGGFQGQRQWTDYMPNGDFMEAILNSSFDWNGIREPFIVATENDHLNGISMLFGHLLSNQAQVFADVRTYWSPEAVEQTTGKKLSGRAANGMIHLINSGSAALDATGKLQNPSKDPTGKPTGEPCMKPFWQINEEEVKACLQATTWPAANYEYFRGGGFSSCFLTDAEMPLTMVRLNLVKGLGPVLQIAEGYSVKIAKEIHEKLNSITDPTWPTTWFVPNITGKGAFTSIYSVMNHWGANHGAFTYGHIGHRYIALASILRIPVALHNVNEERIFRPKMWAAFGTQNLESADFRACDTLGPLYGKLKR